MCISKLLFTLIKEEKIKVSRKKWISGQMQPTGCHLVCHPSV